MREIFLKFKQGLIKNKRLVILFLLFLPTVGVGITFSPFADSQNNTDQNNPAPNYYDSYSIGLPNQNANTANQNSNQKTGSNSNKSTKSTTSGNTNSNSGATDPASESLSATVAFYGDSQTDNDPEQNNHLQVANYILATSANPVFHAGDLMEDGTEASLNYFNSATATLRASRTFYSALGNNDRDPANPTSPSPLYLANFSYPNNEQWYSVNAGNLHVIVLDSAFSSASPTQLGWLQTDLQSAASQSRITGVLYHHPAFSSSISSYLIDNGADFVVAGHNHAYAHSTSSGIHYFVTSGQTSIGYFLLRVYSSYAILSAYNSGNGLVETITISNR